MIRICKFASRLPNIPGLSRRCYSYREHNNISFKGRPGKGALAHITFMSNFSRARQHVCTCWRNPVHSNMKEKKKQLLSIFPKRSLKVLDKFNKGLHAKYS